MRLTLRDIAMTIWQSISIIIVTALICAGLLATATYTLVKPEYTATAKLYVYNEKPAETYISSSDLAVSKSLVDTYLIIIKSDPVLEKVQKDLSVKYPEITTKQILDSISGSAINETEAFYISSKSTNRQLATDIIDDIVKVAPKEIIRVVKAASVEIIEEAKLPSEGDYDWPLYTNTFIGFALGLVISVSFVLIANVTDTTVYGKKEILSTFNLPIIGLIPRQFNNIPSGFRFKKSRNLNARRSGVLTKNTPFAVQEAYRKTRSNIVYLPETSESDCKTFVVTSALASEGKSTFSINLAISLAQSGKKVLLIDGDMRKPKVSKYLLLDEKDGFSEYLAKINNDVEPLKYSDNLDIIVSGKSTSYAAELLSTSRAEEYLEKSKEIYDYIIIDSPPVNEVTDAMIFVDHVSGYIVCAIAGYSDVEETKQAVSALEQIDAKILGFALIGVDPKTEQYGRYRRYGKYRYYSYRYSKEYYNKKKYYSSAYDKKQKGK